MDVENPKAKPNKREEQRLDVVGCGRKDSQMSSTLNRDGIDAHFKS